MIALPLIIFGAWFWISYRKRGLNLTTYILLLYTITAIGSVVLDANNFYVDACKKLPMGVLAPFLYCGLLAFCITPFSKYRAPLFKKQESLRGLKEITIFYFVIFIVVLLVSYQKLIIFTNSDALEINNLRYAQYTGDATSFYDHLSGFPRYICAICSVLAPSSFIMLLFFVYSITYLHNKWWINLMMVISSLTPLLIGMNIVDRSTYAYWILIFGLSYSFFHKQMNSETKKKVIWIGTLVIATILVYFAAVTISRFATRDTGVEGGIITYLGQNYINFCNYIDYVTPGLIMNQVLPITSNYIIKFPIIKPVVASGASGYQLYGFSTFMGMIYISVGIIGLLFYCIVYHVTVRHAIKLSRTSKSKDIWMLICVWALSLVVVTGLFGYYYSTVNGVIAFIIWNVIGFYLYKKNRYIVKG